MPEKTQTEEITVKEAMLRKAKEHRLDEALASLRDKDDEEALRVLLVVYTKGFQDGRASKEMKA